MKLNPETFDETLASFNTAWPVSRLRTMSVAEYADLSNHDSFCYWLEYGTSNLGAIGGIRLNKFELWKPKEIVDFKDDRYRTDGVYTWNGNRGRTLGTAFNDVRNNILQIIALSHAQDWEGIDKVPFHQIGKWKIAFLYSNKTLLPVYSKRALIAIAKGLGQLYAYETKVSVLQRFILQYKPADESVDVFAYGQYAKFAMKSRPNYYIIGSKYGDGNTPVINDFISKSCVAIGFMSHINFGRFIGAAEGEVYEFVDENWNEESPGKPKIKRYFKLLSQIKAGDIIAVKSHGSHNQLTIIAYAQVVEKYGAVYEHNENELGHHIHVEFLEFGLYNNLGLTYAETIHQLKPVKKDDNFYKIFGWYANPKASQNQDDEELLDEETETPEDNDNEDYNDKSETTGHRGSIAAGFVKRIHNRIQNRFIKYLKSTYPNDKNYGEKRRIDARRENASDVFIYEIKPHISAYSCTREAIGQLLDYSHQFQTAKNKHIIVVGPNHPDGNALAFINSVRDNLGLPFKYLAFDEKNMTATEF